MASNSPSAVSVTDTLAALVPLIGRTPTDDGGEDGDAGEWGRSLGQMGTADVYVVDYAGNSEWERHPGDELVMVLDGATTLFMMDGDNDVPHPLAPMELIIVPEGVWHRFETPERTQILTVTPQPTDHSAERPVEN